MASSSSALRAPEPSTISVPAHMSSFQHSGLKFLCLGKYLSGLAGEKDKVICVVKPKVIVASVRGNLTQEMTLPTVASIHYQDAALPAGHVSPAPLSDGSTPPSRTGSPQESSLSRYVDVVVSDFDGTTMAFTINRKHLNSFLGVALYYCPPDTPVHHISGSTVPLFESLTNVKRPAGGNGVLASVVGFLQHAGQDKSGQESLQFLKANDGDQLDSDESLVPLKSGTITSESRESMLAAASLRRAKPSDRSPNIQGLTRALDQMPLDDNLVDMLHEYSVTESPDRGENSPGTALIRSQGRPSERSLPKPRASSLTPQRRDAENRRVIAEGLSAGLEKLARHRDPSDPIDISGDKRKRWALPGDEELYQWKALPNRVSINTDSPSRGPTAIRFAQGGASLTVTPRPQPVNRELAAKEEQGAMMSVIKELRTMQSEINRLKEESTLRQTSSAPVQPPESTRRSASLNDDSDGETMTSPHHVAGRERKQSSSPKSPPLPTRKAPAATVADNVRGSLLPLMNVASQHAAMKAVEELQEIQRGLLDAGNSKYLNPAIQRQLTAMEEPLRVLFRIIAPTVTPVMSEQGRLQGPIPPSSASLAGEFLPVWALVDFGEVNYDRSPLTIRQYHRIVARRVDEENMSHLIIATRQQFALDEGFIQIPFSSVLDVAMGCQPRAVRAQRLLMDGSVTRSDELYDSKSAISIRTRLQHIQIQFECDAECEVWARVFQEVVIMNTKKFPQGRVSGGGYPSATALIASEDL